MPRRRLPDRRSPVLTWIIGFIVFLLLAWGITELLNGEQLEEDTIPLPQSLAEQRRGTYHG